MKEKRLLYVLIAIGIIVAAAILGAVCGRLFLDSII